MNIKRAVFMAVLVVAIAALAVPLVGLRAAASGSGAATAGAAAKARAANAASAKTQQAEQQRDVSGEVQVDQAQAGKISAETLKALLGAINEQRVIGIAFGKPELAADHVILGAFVAIDVDALDINARAFIDDVRNRNGMARGVRRRARADPRKGVAALSDG